MTVTALKREYSSRDLFPKHKDGFKVRLFVKVFKGID